MNDQKRCPRAATAPACPKKAPASGHIEADEPALILSARHLPALQATHAAYRRLFELRALAPEWRAAYAEWRRLAEDLAIALAREFEAQRGLQP